MTLTRRRVDPNLHHVAAAVRMNVHEYKQYTYDIQRFIESHGIKLNGWQTWGLAPFDVLNARRGQPIPQEVLSLLNAAIRGRTDVSNKFTAANLHANNQYDQSDVSHRVFIEQLRTIRRVWFPEAAREPTPEADVIGLKEIPKLIPEKLRLSAGCPFSTVTGDQANPFYKVMFDSPVEMTIIAGVEQRKFHISNGEVTLAPRHLDHGDSAASKKPVCDTSAEQPAFVTPPEPAHSHESNTTGTPNVKKAFKGVIDRVLPNQTMQKRECGKRKRQVNKTPICNKRQSFGETGPEYIEISSDEEPEDDDSGVQSFLACEAVTKDDVNVAEENERPIRRLGCNGKLWVIELSLEGECMTFWDPSGGNPTTYIDDEVGKASLRYLIDSDTMVVATTIWNGQKRELSNAAVRAIAWHEGNPFVELLPEYLDGASASTSVAERKRDMEGYVRDMVDGTECRSNGTA